MELGIRRQLIIDITLNNLNTGHFGIEHRLFLEKKAGESAQHVVMKFLSWLILFRPGLVVERSVGEHYKPDLVRLRPNGDVSDWIDCGQTSLTKLSSIVARHRETQFTIVKSKPSALRHYYQRAVARKKTLEAIQYLSFQSPGINPICAALRKRHKIVATVGEGPDVLFLSIDGYDSDVRLFRLGAWSEPSL